MSSAVEALEALAARGWTLGVAESLTGGALTSALVEVPGASRVVLGGIVAYATPVKHTVLGVDAALLAAHGAVHPEVARQMAAGVRRAVAVGDHPADVGVATTGVAGPDSPDGQPVGTVHVAVVTPLRAAEAVFHFEGDRAGVRGHSVDAALSLLTDLVRE